MYFALLIGIIVFSGIMFIIYVLSEYHIIKDEIEEKKKRDRPKDTLDKEIEKEYRTLEELRNTQKRLRELETLKAQREDILESLEKINKRMEKHYE